MVQTWQANTIPLPHVIRSIKSIDVGCEGAAVTVQPKEVQSVVFDEIIEENFPKDNFPKGRVVKYFPYQGYGFVAGRGGKEIYFSMNEVDLVGEKTPEALKTGSVVGYDVSWTSHGLHIKKLKIY